MVEVKMLTSLKKFLPPGATGEKAVIPIERGATLIELKKRLGIPVEEFKGIVIDKRHNEIEDTQVLEDGDSLTFYASVGGG